MHTLNVVLKTTCCFINISEVCYYGKRHHIKDPGSAITHFIGMLMAIFAAVPLLIKAAHEPSRIYIGSLTVYAISLILLYAASTTYHTFDISPKVNTILKKSII